LIKAFERLAVEDKIVLLRFLVGLAYGVAVFTVSLLVSPTALSPAAWGTSVIVYYFTTVYVAIKFGVRSWFLVYLRGLATFYGTWMLTAILLYEAIGYLGLGA